ncbi:hypothetical protein [Pseudaquidulcibacter saccharophilus]|uniref:hypothetical protein n=1 Tax=Pseudaquidulcibacter saccharophilus TaxID=2831900 RepID=UPI001EFF0240|nr:hypothetical protein [Pseudaquidulcibacter saccharophilus]
MENDEKQSLKSDIEYIKALAEGGEKPSKGEYKKIAFFAILLIIGFTFALGGNFYINKYKELQPHRNISLFFELLGSIIWICTSGYAFVWAISLIPRKWITRISKRGFQGIWSGIFLFWISNQICELAFANGVSNGKLLEKIKDWEIGPLNYVGIFNTILSPYSNIQLILVLSLGWWISGSLARKKIIMLFGFIGLILAPFYAHNLVFLQGYFVGELSIIVMLLLIPAIFFAMLQKSSSLSE